MPLFSIKLRAFDTNLVENSVSETKKLAKLSNFRIKSVVRLPSIKKRFTVIRSPHVYNKSREQFEIKTCSRLIQLQLNKKLISKSAFLEFIKLVTSKIPAGVSIKVTYLT